MTRPRKDLESVRDLLAQGHPVAEIARRAGIPPSTVRMWVDGGLDSCLDARYGLHKPDELCPKVRDVTESSYSYLLRLYLGDGCISTGRGDVYKLRIFQDNRYPILVHQCQIAMQWVIPNKAGVAQQQGCKEIYSFSKHWPCMFPQHGAGPKHKRPITLEPWQRWIAIERNPELLLRGLIHSDGCRTINRVKGGRYSYVRYMFSNRSEDIRRIFTDACERAGIEWRQSYHWMISVSRRSSVEKMDQFIGPKS